MTKGTYVRLSENMTVTELKSRLGAQLKPTDPTVDFPSWIWPYIRNAVKAGKLVFSSRSKKLAVPKNADINDYPLPVIGYIQQAGVSFPGVELAAVPDGFFSLVKDAMSDKYMDQYGMVDPENFHHIPRPLWPYVRFKKGFLFGKVFDKLGKVDPEDAGDFPPGLWPYI